MAMAMVWRGPTTTTTTTTTKRRRSRRSCGGAREHRTGAGEGRNCCRINSKRRSFPNRRPVWASETARLSEEAVKSTRRREVLSISAGLGLSLVFSKGGDSARASEQNAVPLDGMEERGRAELEGRTDCSCETACTANSNPVVEALPKPLVAWSKVTGTCLPWGPGGPIGVLAGALLFRRATLSLTEGNRTFKDARDVDTRRSVEVEQGLRSLDKLAKQNTPFVGATLVLLLSIPRTTTGAAIGIGSAVLGIGAAALKTKEDA